MITVVRDGAEHLERTILSVLEYPARIDYVIIDGLSGDGTQRIIGRYADRLHYWISEKDQGIYHAMNKGWQAARRESFILYLGAGDRLVSLPELAGRRSNEVLYGTVRSGKRAFHPKTGFHLKLYNSLHHQALLVNRMLHPEPPFDPRFPVYADFDFNQRLMKSGAEFVFAPDLACCVLPGGVSDAGGILESLRVIRKNFGWCWAVSAWTAFLAVRTVPFLHRLRPFRERSLPAGQGE